MAEDFVASDTALLDLLRWHPSMTVSELAESMQVTATAVRQRLNRLLAQQYVERTTTKCGRGRPSHHYQLTDKGRRKAGSNIVDLALALWEELRRIPDPQVRQGLLQRLAKRLALLYVDRVHGDTLEERMRSLSAAFAEKRIPLIVDHNGTPAMTQVSCPYPGLGDENRTICAMERLLYSELLGESVHLSRCRLDGQGMCTFCAQEPARGVGPGRSAPQQTRPISA